MLLRINEITLPSSLLVTMLTFVCLSDRTEYEVDVSLVSG